MDNVTIEYQYIKIEDRQFATFEENLTAGEDTAISNEVNFNYNFETNVLVCNDTIGYVQNEKPILKISLASYFHINPDSIKTLITDKGIHMPKGILCQFASLNYGAMRGVLFEKTKDTGLNKLILPPFFFDTLIKEDALFVKSNNGK